MPSADDWETIAHCLQGDLRHNGTYTGRVCRKPNLCRQAGECYFVAALRAHDAADGSVKRSTRRPLDSMTRSY
jgi:hypothetical protein